MSDMQDIREMMASSCNAYFSVLQGSDLLPNEQEVTFEFNYLVAISVVVRPVEIGVKLYPVFSTKTDKIRNDQY